MASVTTIYPSVSKQPETISNVADNDAATILTKLLAVDGAGSTLDSDTVDTKHASELLARGNHTGTQLAETISDFASAAASSNGSFATRTSIKGAALEAGSVAYLAEAGREGFFRLTSGNYASRVTADTQEGLYFADGTIASTTAAWVRIYDGYPWANWFGVKSDNSTDDTTALQAAYTMCGTYRLGGLRLKSGVTVFETLTMDKANTVIYGAGYNVNHNLTFGWENTSPDGTVLKCSGLTASTGIKISAMGTYICGASMTSTAARYAATPWYDDYAVHCEPADTSGASCAELGFDKFHVMFQPCHGMALIDNCINSVLGRIIVSKNLGHGFAILGGSYTGRSVLNRTGQIIVQSLRASRNGGQGLIVGDIAPLVAGSIDTGSIPYRVWVNNYEQFYNNQSTEASLAVTTQASGTLLTGCTLYGEEIFVGNSGLGGSETSDQRAVGAYIIGRDIKFEVSRFVNVGNPTFPYAAYVDRYTGGGFDTFDVDFGMCYIQHATEGAGYYDPAIYCASGVRSIKAQNMSGHSDIASLIDPSITKCEIIDYTRTLNNQRLNFPNMELIGTGAVSATLTIASGVIAPTGSFHAVDTESAAASDDLDTITAPFSSGFLILRSANSARDVVVKHNTGNIRLNGGSDKTLDNSSDLIFLFYDGFQWKEVGGNGLFSYAS